MNRNYRIIKHPIIDFRRGRRIIFYYEDKAIEAYEGESILAALYAAGYRVFSYSPDGKRPRGAFCMAGKCSSCLSIVDGVPNTRICIEPVREGVRVYKQRGTAEVPKKTSYTPAETIEIDADALIIGGGPAGLQASLVLADLGLNVVLVDDHFRLGGQLIKQTHRFFGDKKFYGGIRGFKIAEKLSKLIEEKRNIHIYTRAYAYGLFRNNIIGVAVRGDKPVNLLVKPRAIIGATGAYEKTILFENNDLPGIMGALGAQTLMNEYGVKPGDRALVIGSGNVGLIASYQLLQAGVKVVGITEILPRISGWFVHAAKIRRLGVPIYTRHTITKALGSDRVEKAEISMVNDKFEPIPGSEKVFDVDLVLLAVGLQPDYTFYSQAGAVMKYVPELGGLVPIRTKYMETSVENLYVAGDAGGIEEPTAAFIEGEIAALSAAIKLGIDKGSVRKRRDELLDYLWNEYRLSPVVSRVRAGKLKITVSEEEMEKIRRGEYDGI
ncbi:2Fe-2S iron-sulfur cluster-binding protein [Staphylothermus hellenicus]|nr:2Fe-2S iron-sulfur cluster-binding protein [Staphylothermus hellenicus]